MYSELQLSSAICSDDNSAITMTPNNANSDLSNGFEQVGEYSSWVSTGSSSIRGYKQYVYFSPLTSEMAVSIRTYCDNINTIYENDDSISATFVHSLEMRLKHGENGDPYNIANIAGVDCYDFEILDGSTAYGFLSDLFLGAFTHIGFNLSSLSIFPSAATGTVELSDNYKNAYVKVSFGTGDNHNFDDISTGLPICFLLSKNQAGYIGNSKLIAITAITYKTSVMNANTLQTQIYYTTSPTLTKTYSINLQ